MSHFGSIGNLLNFYNAWMIFVRIDNISNRLYADVFKIYAKGFLVFLWRCSFQQYLHNDYETVKSIDFQQR